MAHETQNIFEAIARSLVTTSSQALQDKSSNQHSRRTKKRVVKRNARKTR